MPYDNKPDALNGDSVDVLGLGKNALFIFDANAADPTRPFVAVTPGHLLGLDARSVVSQQTLDLSAGTAVPLPAPPAGATSVQVQPQGADVRLNLAGGTPTASTGLLYGEGGIYDLMTLTNVKLIGTASGAGVQAELVWRG